MAGKAIIVAGGVVHSADLLKELHRGYDLLLAADSGGTVLYELGYLPNLLIGDFDSLDGDLLAFYRAKGVEITKFPPEKDWTDLELAVQTVINRNVQEIIIYGAIGDRLDHTLGNLSLLYQAMESGVKAVIVGLRERIFLLGPDETLTLSPTENTFFSLLPLYPGVEGVTEQGAKYPLANASIPFGSTRGIHNEFKTGPVTISINRGYAFVIVHTEQS
ncbi:MAG TPA: thiamine diphosphokinase [Bacillota bacterium]